MVWKQRKQLLPLHESRLQMLFYQIPFKKDILVGTEGSKVVFIWQSISERQHQDLFISQENFLCI